MICMSASYLLQKEKLFLTTKIRIKILSNIHETNRNIWNTTKLSSYYYFHIRLVPAQDGPFFYTRSHLSALQNCALLFSTNFQFIFLFKECITQLIHWIVSCTIFQKVFQVFIKFKHSFVAIELLTFYKNAKKLFYCSRELSLFWLNK